MELHSPVKLIKRSAGQSSVAAAAYRSASRIRDLRTGEIHDYTNKKGVEFNTILFPDGTPEHIEDRASLWNAAEQNENRKNSQTARDIEISLPAEFSTEQRREAGLQIGQFLSEKYGTAVDLCWHVPTKDKNGKYRGDDRNFHLHVLMTTRRFENGDWAKTKDRTLDDLFGKGKDEIARLRQGIADSINDIAARDNVPVYVEHLSFERRGLDKEALKPVSKEAYELEKDGIETDIVKENEAIKRRNAEREELKRQKNIIDFEIAREQMKQKGQIPPEKAPQSEPFDKYAAFYQQTYKRRQSVLNSFEKDYGEQRQQSIDELVKLEQANERSRGIFKFWRNITGRTERDQARIAEIQAQLEAIHQKKQQTLEFFEKERQQRLDDLQKAAADRYQMPEAANDEPDKTPDHIDRDELNAYLEAEEADQELDQDFDFGLER